MSNVNLLITRASRFHAPGDFRARSRLLRRVLCAMSSCVLSGIDAMTHKWLNQGQNPPRIPEVYTLTKIHKPVPVGRPIVSGSGGPTERISSFVDSLLQPIAKNKSRTSKTLRTLSTSLKTRKFQTKQFLLYLMSHHFTLISLRKKGLQLFANTMKSIISLNHPSPLQLLGNS